LSMGISWSEPMEDLKDREAKAIEELDLLVWDQASTLSLDRVKNVVYTRGVGVKNLRNAMKDREADQIRKSRFFERNGVEDMRLFHDFNASRYNLAAFYLDICYAV
jgi:hypothetical protein